VVWTENFVPADGMTVTFRARPRSVGHQPVSLGATAEFVDNSDRKGKFVYPPIPDIDVLAPFPVPTPTLPLPQPFVGEGAGGRGPATPTPDPCVINATHTVAPPVLPLGANVAVTLHLGARCQPPPPSPLHIALVVDGFSSMEGPTLRDLRAVGKKLVDSLDLPNNPHIKLAVVEVIPNRGRGIQPTAERERARTLAVLTNDGERIKRMVMRIKAEGRTQVDLGIRKGIDELRRGRLAVTPGASNDEVMIVFSDGENTDRCRAISEAARAAKSQGILMITVCMGHECDAYCMRGAASSARYFYGLESWMGLNAVFTRITQDIRTITLRRAELIDVLPPGLDFVTDSGIPEPLVVPLPDGTHLEWSMPYVPREGVTVTFQAIPRSPGRQPVSVDTHADVIDSWNRPRTVRFPIPSIDVAVP